MFKTFQTMMSKVAITYKVSSSLEIVLIHLRNLCVSNYEFPNLVTIDLTKLESDSSGIFHFTITAAKSFTFFVLINGVLEKTNDMEVSVTYDIGVSEGQVVILSLFTFVFLMFFGVVFIRTLLIPALFFIVFPPTALVLAVKRTTNFIQELNTQLQQL